MINLNSSSKAICSLSKLLTTATLVTVLAVGNTGCSMVSVYKIDVPQGTPLTQGQAAQIKIGMSSEQVIALLGSPAITDTMNPNRWDYIYNFDAGTFGKRAGKTDVSANQQHLSIHFSNNKVSKIEGINRFPYS